MDTKQLKIPEGTEKESWFERLDNWWYDFTKYSWYRRNIVDNWKAFKNGVSNLIDWFPIVWNNYNWDDAYIMKMLKRKIELTRDTILENDIICEEDQQRIKRYTTLCSKLIHHFLEETYESEYHDYQKNKFEWTPLEGGNYELDIQEISDNLDEYFKKYPNDYRRTVQFFAKHYPDRDVAAKENRSFFALMMSTLRQKRANGLIWKILDSEIRTWWD